MALELDPEVAAGLAAVAEAAGGALPPPAPPGDWRARREMFDALLTSMADSEQLPADVTIGSREATGSDGAVVPLRWYRPGRSPAGEAGPAWLYIHGGGMILGSAEMSEPNVAGLASQSGVPILSVDYRLAPEHPHPTPVEDCYAALTHLHDHASELGVDPGRIGVAGDSAGGGLAAALSLLARDRGGPAIAFQLLVYPMLDDRTVVPDPAIAPYATWTYDDNLTGWAALLGDDRSGPDHPVVAVPARAGDLRGLPPAYIEVGELDIFRDEDIEYASRLRAAGVSAELHVHPGAPHAFEGFAPQAAVSRRAVADRLRVLRSI